MDKLFHPTLDFSLLDTCLPIHAGIELVEGEPENIYDYQEMLLLKKVIRSICSSTWQYDCLFNISLGLSSKQENAKVLIKPFVKIISQSPLDSPHKASVNGNAESFSMPWRHHVICNTFSLIKRTLSDIIIQNDRQNYTRRLDSILHEIVEWQFNIFDNSDHLFEWYRFNWH